MLNRVVLVGRLTKDPELKMTSTGTPVASFTIAVNRTFTNQQGEREADFIPIVVWRRQAENVNQYVRKGSLVGVDGRIQVRHYENQEGRRVYVTEVVAESVQFLEPRNASGNTNNSYGFNDPGPVDPGAGFGSQNAYQGETATAKQPAKWDEDPFANNGQKIDISEDDLPF